MKRPRREVVRAEPTRQRALRPTRSPPVTMMLQMARASSGLRAHRAPIFGDRVIRERDFLEQGAGVPRNPHVCRVNEGRGLVLLRITSAWISRSGNHCPNNLRKL